MSDACRGGPSRGSISFVDNWRNSMVAGRRDAYFRTLASAPGWKLDAVGSAGGAWIRAALPTGSGFLPPPRRTVHAVLPHTAHRRPLPAAFGLARQSRKGLGVTTSRSRLTSPMRFGDTKA